VCATVFPRIAIIHTPTTNNRQQTPKREQHTAAAARHYLFGDADVGVGVGALDPLGREIGIEVQHAARHQAHNPHEFAPLVLPVARHGVLALALSCSLTHNLTLAHATHKTHTQCSCVQQRKRHSGVMAMCVKTQQEESVGTDFCFLVAWAAPAVTAENLMPILIFSVQIMLFCRSPRKRQCFDLLKLAL